MPRLRISLLLSFVFAAALITSAQDDGQNSGGGNAIWIHLAK